jgi:DNA-binding NarL/FixJ family response regulator
MAELSMRSPAEWLAHNDPETMTVPPADDHLPTTVITGSLAWCVAAARQVFTDVGIAFDTLATAGFDAADARLRADPEAPLVFVCGTATPRHFDGLDRLHGEHPHAHLIAASPEPDLHVAQHARVLGLRGYLHFDATAEEIAGVIRRVIMGERAYLPADGGQMPQTARIADPDLERRVQRLTRRERQVMDLLGRGYANRDIADALGLREGTIRIYVHRVIRQLGMRNRTDVALCASRIRSSA